MTTPIEYLTQAHFKYLNKRIDNVAGVNRRLLTLVKAVEGLSIQNQILKNEINTLDMRLRKLEVRIYKYKYPIPPPTDEVKKDAV
ncbi:hypothetical protein MUP79_03355 [Candidatus Bathyarchaeota archaeon]|nr:hypothetical protein [Candidatus Bathyarchaeota archaeon]